MKGKSYYTLWKFENFKLISKFDFFFLQKKEVTFHNYNHYITVVSYHLYNNLFFNSSSSSLIESDVSESLIILWKKLKWKLMKK